MKKNKRTSAAMANAIAWAAMVIATPLVMSDAPVEQKSFLLLLQIAGWLSVNLALANNSRSLKAEWSCITKRLRPGR